MKTHRYQFSDRQHGMAAVEFALIASLLFTLLLGIAEFGRLLFYWNTATEASRLGARVAAVCDLNDSEIKRRMTALFPLLADSDIVVDYLPAGCIKTSCQQITVRITASSPIQTFIPFVPLSITLPPFKTTLPRESLTSTSNPVCG